MKHIGVLIYTYDRVDDAKINMEIVRNVWGTNEYFRHVTIVHAFNGEKEWYPNAYLEDELVTMKNSWHFQGASDLIDAGMQVFVEKYPDIDYVVVLAADTWLIDPSYVQGVVSKMEQGDSYIATCTWGLPDRNEINIMGMAVDFCIVDLRWARQYNMFPIQYGEFYKKYGELFLYQRGENVMLEKLMYARYLQALNREDNFGGVARKRGIEKMLMLTERESIHSHSDEKGFLHRNMYWPEMGLLTHHDPAPKKEILKVRNIAAGANVQKLLQSDDLSYYNGGTTQLEHNCN